MATTSARLSLTKPSDAEDADIATINANMDKIDSFIGYHVCTSTTRPASPYVGLAIYETDTGNRYIYTGSWVWTGNSDDSLNGQVMARQRQATQALGAAAWSGITWQNLTTTAFNNAKYFGTTSPTWAIMSNNAIKFLKPGVYNINIRVGVTPSSAGAGILRLVRASTPHDPVLPSADGYWEAEDRQYLGHEGGVDPQVLKINHTYAAAVANEYLLPAIYTQYSSTIYGSSYPTTSLIVTRLASL